MGPQWARRDLQGEAPPLDGIVVAHPAVLLDAQDLAHPAGAIVEKALPASAGVTAKATLWAGQSLSASHRLAAATVVMPARASSFGSRSCNGGRRARNGRASGE
jgi:hypothetical protein